MRTHTKEATWIQDPASPSPVQDTSSKQQTKQIYKPSHQQTGLPHSALTIRGKTNKQTKKQKYKPSHQQIWLPPHSALAIRGKTNKETNKNSAQISPYKKLTQTTGPTFSSVTQLCPPLCYPMNRSTPGLPVHHQLPEFTQTHVDWVGDAIQPSHPLSSPSPPAPNPSQHQGLFQWVNSSHEVAKVLEFQLQHQSLQWTPRTDLL